MVDSEQVNAGWINGALYPGFIIVNLEYMVPNFPRKGFKDFCIRGFYWKRCKPILFLDRYDVWQNSYPQTIT